MNFTTVAYAGMHSEAEPEVLKGLSLPGAAPAQSRGVMYLRALAGGLPGSWQSDHRKESETFVGWNGVAIHQKCLQFMQADCAVYRDISPKAKRKRLAKVYTTQDESEEMPETHPLLKLLKRPNKWQSGAVFRYSVGLQLGLTGRAMIWNVPNRAGAMGVNVGNGKTAMRIVIPTAYASPVPPSEGLPLGGWRIQPVMGYWGGDPDGFVEMFGGAHLAYGKVVPTEQMQTISWPHPLYVEDGCSPTGRGAAWIDGSSQVARAQWAQLNNGADPSLHIEVDPEVQFDEEAADRYSEKMKAKYGGAHNVGKVLFTQGGKVTPLSISPKDMSYIEAHSMYRDAIMANHGAVPMDPSDTYAGYFAKVKQFTELTVQPELNLLADADTERFAEEFGASGALTIEYTAKSIDDPEVMDRETNTLVNAKVITKNEVRARYGLAPLPGADGEELAGQPAPTTAMNVNGTLGVQGNGFGLSLPTNDSTGISGMPSLNLPQSGGAGPVPRLSLNGKHNGNGHAKCWEGYP